MKHKKQILLFVSIFLFSIIFTITSLTISHGLDSYCTMCNGYKNTAIWFLQNGRIFSYLFYMLFDFIKLPYDSLRIISVITSNIILSITILLIYKEIINNYQIKNKFFNLFLIGLIFLIYYSPLMPSILVLDEAFIINLGILFLTLSSITILKNTSKNYLKSLLFAVLGVSCYQGISSYLFISLFIILLSKEEYRKNIKLYLNKFILLISIYGLSNVSNLIIIKIISYITNEKISKIGSISIISNIKKIITVFIPKAYKYFFRYINPLYYYLSITLLLLITIIYIIKNKDKINNLILLILLILSCSLVPFIPNIFLSSSSNYIESRMVLTIGIIPIVIIIYILLSFKINKQILSGLLIISIFLFLISFKSNIQNMNIDKKRYQQDQEYLLQVVNYIKNYEENNSVYIDTIYYARDNDVAYYYPTGFPNDTNIRLLAVDWALDCALSYKLNREINFEKMPDEKRRQLFANLEYDEFSQEQLVIDKNILYLLVY